MTNNYNYNLANKLFAYIKEAKGLTPELAELYQNSLIFLGNEQQIYVPAKQAYVGIGTTAYNNTQTAINELKSAIAGIENGSGLANVRKLWVGAGPYAYDWYGSNAYPEFENNINTMTTYLTGDVTIWGAGINTDATTGLTYDHVDWVATNDGGFQSFTGGKSAAEAATSGITISYVSLFEEETDPTTSVKYMSPRKQLITIDDSKTWSYMRGAYNYSVNFTKDYISSRIESVYKNLIGSSDIVMMPISAEDFANSNYTADKIYLRDKSCNAPLTFTSGDDAIVDASDFTTLNGDSTSDVLKDTTKKKWIKYSDYETYAYRLKLGNWWEPEAEKTNVYQIYVKINGNVTTYNGNLSDGINTLKEVAKLLDQLSDGAIGSVTYLTKEQWETGNHTDGVDNYYRVRDKNGNPVTNENKYGYFVNPGDPENLGIQIAYSIAGNKAEIDDLHYHVELAEQGVTTVRSIGIDASPMVYAHATSSQTFTQTDTNQSTPNGYSVGDVCNMIGLNLAMTYTTLNPSYNNNNNVHGVDYYNGAYQKLDKYQWGGLSLTYYTWNGYTSTYVSHTGVLPLTEEWNTQYYYKGDSTTYTYVNDKFALITNEAEFVETLERFIQNQDGHFETTNATQYVANTYYKRVSIGPDIVTHANTTDFGNQIATTAWTLALLNDMNIQGSSLNDASSILEEIKKKVDTLDFKMAYSDFKDPISGVPGTTEWENNYNTALQTWYTTYFSGSIWESGKLKPYAKIGYVGNKVRSQYISNFEEENGIVKVTETKELPTDMLDINTSIWGNQDSIEFVKDYAAIEYSGRSNLFTLINSIENHQIYYKNGTKTYQPAIGTEDMNDLYYIDDNGLFEELIDAPVQIMNASQTDSAYWRQRYVKADAYYEVDIDTIKFENETTITEFSYGKYDNNGNMATYVASDTPLVFYKVSNIPSNTYSTKYITGAVQHYSYLNDGGEGQNKFSLVTHITHLEDASPINTGLVDAWDVASFISNMCEWADLDDLWVKDVK